MKRHKSLLFFRTCNNPPSPTHQQQYKSTKKHTLSHPLILFSPVRFYYTFILLHFSHLTSTFFLFTFRLLSSTITTTTKMKLKITKRRCCEICQKITILCLIVVVVVKRTFVKDVSEEDSNEQQRRRRYCLHRLRRR